jgi:hypothetical protein
MDQLDEWSPNLDEAQKNKVLRDNFVRLNKALQFTGAELISDTNARIAQTVSTTTYTTLTAFQGKFQSSGGLCFFVGNLYAVTNNNNCFVSLVIDGIEKKVVQVASSAGTNVMLPIFWGGLMNAGAHTIALQAKVSGGSLTVGATDTDSGYYVIEFRKG